MKFLHTAAMTAVLAFAVAGAAHAEDPVARGAYLVRVMGCGDCHTPGTLLGKPDFSMTLAGSNVGFAVPGLGIHWGPNLTPDPETGLGTWTEAQIVTAIRTGVRPDGRKLIPIMPYENFAALTDADAQAIAAYLKSLKPIHHQVPGPVPSGGKAPAPYMMVMMPD
jgi:mono/diheme cytochrome c family protein